MNQKIIAAVVLCGLIVGGAGFTYIDSQNNKNEKMAMEKKSVDEAMMKKDDADAMTKETDAMEKGDTMSKHGAYITLADYNNNPTKYTESKKIYFFHASWCPICQGIEKEINVDMSKIPGGVTIIKTDFDNSKDLRQKYGVTVQSTFVQVDNSGNESAQWSADSLATAIKGIK